MGVSFSKLKFKFLLLFLFAFHQIATAGEIIQITAANRHLVPKGKEVDAIDGDWIMKNDKVIAVIGNAVEGREANQMVQGIQGAVIDFTSLAANNDQLVVFYPQGFRLDSVSAHRIEVIKSGGKEIVLKAIRNPTATEPYGSETAYSLRDGENFLRITTTHHNPGTTAVSFYLADKIRLDNDIEDHSAKGNHALSFIYNKWFDAAYGVYRPNGEIYFPGRPPRKGLNSIGLWLDYPDFKANPSDSLTTLNPSQKIEISRYLVYGQDVAELQRITQAPKKGAPTPTTFMVTDTRKKPIAGMFIDIMDNRSERLSFAITDAAGSAKIPLAPGTYEYTATKIGHDTIQSTVTVGKKAATVAAVVQPLTSLRFAVEEEGGERRLPVKIEFAGINKTPNPFLGPAKRAEGVNNLYYALNQGPFQVPLPPGRYAVTISHGPEYNAITQEIEVKRGETNTIKVALKRAFSTPNWIISDFHNHTTGSGDSGAEIRSRIINMAASGIEFAPATEHNRISSFTDEIKRLQLEQHIASAPGIELSGRPGPGDTNHQIAFPLTIQEGKQGNGAPKTHVDPYVQMKRLFDYDNQKFKLVQQNHPNIGWLYFDKNRDGEVDAGFGTREFTDVMEIQGEMLRILEVTSEASKNKKSRVFHWLQMLNQGDRIYGTATSDNHAVGHGSGALFSYVYTKNDQPAQADAVDIAQHAKQGHIIMSNGPFIKTDINGGMPGDEIKSSKGADLKMNIEVFAAEQSRIDRVQLLVNGRQDHRLTFTRETHPQLFSSTPLQFKHTFSLPLTDDAHVIVVATGDSSQKQGAGRRAKANHPFAVANPVFIDRDGNGFVPNKDLLGEPLPTHKLKKGLTQVSDDED
ncbi:hypothetical protein BH24BAC1_BH24BAC1_25580 [soil metagenome]